MKTLALALAATTIASAPAMAGTYVNVESNASYTGNDYTSRTTDINSDKRKRLTTSLQPMVTSVD